MNQDLIKVISVDKINKNKEPKPPIAKKKKHTKHQNKLGETTHITSNNSPL